MEACTEYLKNNDAKEMRLYVVSDREDTINFYTRYGFKVIETLNGDILHAYYEEWKDVHVMQKLF